MNIIRRDKSAVRFRELAETLRQKIVRGEYRPGDLIPSEPELGSIYHVSRMTVRNAVELLVQEDLLRKERGRGRGTVVLRQGVRRSRNRVGLSFGTMSVASRDQWNLSDTSPVMQGITESLNIWESNLNVFTLAPGVNQLEYVKSIVGRNIIDGLFLFPMAEYTAGIVGYLRENKIPTVFIATTSTDSPALPPGIPSVRIDETAGIDIFLEQHRNSYRSLSFLGTDGSELDRTIRLFNLSRGIRNFKVSSFRLAPGSDYFADVKKVLRDLSSDRENLLLVATNELTSYADAAISSLALRVPGQLSVACFKHYVHLPERAESRFSHISRDYIGVGRAAGKMMLEIAGVNMPEPGLTLDRSLLFPSEFVDRGTTRTAGSPPAGESQKKRIAVKNDL